MLGLATLWVVIVAAEAGDTSTKALLRSDAGLQSNSHSYAWSPQSWHDLPMIETPLVFFGPYSGSLPATFPLTIASMRSNQDCCTFIAVHSGHEYPSDEVEMIRRAQPPSNFHWVHLDGAELEQLFHNAVGIQVQSKHVIDPIPQVHHKWNDWRVFAPRLLQAHLTPSVEFWGYLEHDAIYGNIANFLPQIRAYDVFTAADAGTDRVSAPFLLHRLGPITDSFVQRWLGDGCLEDPKWKWCDEASTTDCIQHPDDGTSMGPCAARGLRANFPLREKQMCTVDQSGMSVAWTNDGETLCGNDPVIGIHFHTRRPAAGQAFLQLSENGVKELMSMGWVFEVGYEKDPTCPSCIAMPSTFRAGGSPSPAYMTVAAHVP